MTDILDYLPRFVTKDRVILPEDISHIDLVTDTVICKNGDTYSLKDCRIDAQAPFRDKNGNRVFERDIDATGGVVYRNGVGRWMLRHDDDFNAPVELRHIEVTGMVPFEEGKCK